MGDNYRFVCIDFFYNVDTDNPLVSKEASWVDEDTAKVTISFQPQKTETTEDLPGDSEIFVIIDTSSTSLNWQRPNSDVLLGPSSDELRSIS